MLLAGGTDGNEQLTAITGALLIALLAVIGLTIVFIGQMISLHLFVGLLLIGPVSLKMGSTGYRFARYYTHDVAYREKGPPALVMRLSAPIVVLSTVVVFVSGIVLLFDGPVGRDQWLSIHKVSFIVWGVFTALHVLGHLPGFGSTLAAARPGLSSGAVPPGNSGRWISVASAVVAGLVLAVVLIPQFAPWTAHGVFVHHHHHG
jgi:hypothetical protein